MALPHAGRLGPEGLASFIARGYAIVDPVLPASFHTNLLAFLEQRESALNPGELAAAAPLDELWTDPSEATHNLQRTSIPTGVRTGTRAWGIQ